MSEILLNMIHQLNERWQDQAAHIDKQAAMINTMHRDFSEIVRVIDENLNLKDKKPID